MLCAINSSWASRRRKGPQARRRGAGFMLVEVLVSVLLFSVGVLAIVGLQASMSRAQTASKDRADAANLANEIIGVMWSDAVNINSYNGTSCANYGRCEDWANKLSNVLPKGTQSIKVTPVLGEIGVFDIAIAITWTLPDGGAHTYTTQTTISTN